jgi:biopolymer transport protein ExbD
MITSSKKRQFFISEPNFIPLLDFMLVLVIMFVMLLGPVQQALQLPIPEVKEGMASTIDKQRLLISLEGKNSIYIGDKHFSNLNELEQHLKSQSNLTEITIAIDKKLEVDLLMKLFAVTKSLGINTANIQVDNEK